MIKTTYLVLVLIVLAVFTSPGRTNTQSQDDARAERYEQAKRYFPTVDYNEPALPHTQENRAKNEKKKRFNELGDWVTSNTRPYIVAIHSSANTFDFPALPVAQE